MYQNLILLAWSAGFNRTFMELKSLNIKGKTYVSMVLIVPLWNWNSSISDWDLNLLVGFNRTFMELKFVLLYHYLIQYRVLIVPLWNWNYQQNQTLVLASRFNRTFMELKFTSIHWQIRFSQVLIVPLWNWNTATARPSIGERYEF